MASDFEEKQVSKEKHYTTLGSFASKCGVVDGRVVSDKPSHSYESNTLELVREFRRQSFVGPMVAASSSCNGDLIAAGCSYYVAERCNYYVAEKFDIRKKKFLEIFNTSPLPLGVSHGKTAL